MFAMQTNTQSFTQSNTQYELVPIFKIIQCSFRAFFPVSWFLHSIVSSYTEYLNFEEIVGLAILFLAVSGVCAFFVKTIIQSTDNKDFYLCFEIGFNWLCFWSFSIVTKHQNATISTFLFIVASTFAHAIQKRIPWDFSIILVLVVLIYTSTQKLSFQTNNIQLNDKKDIWMYFDVALLAILANSALWPHEIYFLQRQNENLNSRNSKNAKIGIASIKNIFINIILLFVIHTLVLIFGLSNILWLAVTENYFDFYNGWWIVCLLVTFLLSTQYSDNDITWSCYSDGDIKWPILSSLTAALCIFTRIFYFIVKQSQTLVLLSTVVLIALGCLYELWNFHENSNKKKK